MPFWFYFIVGIGIDLFTLWWKVVKAVTLKLIKPFFIHPIVVPIKRDRAEICSKNSEEHSRKYWKPKKMTKLNLSLFTMINPAYWRQIRFTFTNKTIHNFSKQEKSTIPFGSQCACGCFHTSIIYVWLLASLTYRRKKMPALEIVTLYLLNIFLLCHGLEKTTEAYDVSGYNS